MHSISFINIHLNIFLLVFTSQNLSFLVFYISYYSESQILASRKLNK